MKTLNRQQGQTLIETAIILVLLLLIVFGITEFARAWFTKNSLKNSARQGARVAVVTPPSDLTASFDCINTTCPYNSNVVKNAVCCQPGIPKAPQYNTTCELKCFHYDSGTTQEIPCNTIISNDYIKATVQSTFFFAIGGHRLTFLGMDIWPWPQSMPFSADASMRYE